MILGGQGYVGSAVAAHLRTASIPVHSVDSAPRNAPGLPSDRSRRYEDLTADELAPYTAIVLLAGHSSVAACDRFPAEAFTNNVSGFVELVHKLRAQKLIFASTISVYVNTGGRLADETDPLPEPVSFYDLHKQTVERYAALAYPNHYALRLGTVCGPSPNVRDELLLNSLVRSAVHAGQIQVANRQAYRPLLGVGDLCRAVEALVTRPVPPGCYNLASLNVRIGEAADYVARRFQVPCVEVQRPNHYDIQVATGKFTRASGMEFRDTLAGLVESLYAFYVPVP
jgi:nucleoside-diphosphate-sugar epimerase